MERTDVVIWNRLDVVGEDFHVASLHVFKRIFIINFSHSSLTCDDKILIGFIRRAMTAITQFYFHKNMCDTSFSQRMFSLSLSCSLWIFYLSLKILIYNVVEYLWVVMEDCVECRVEKLC